MKSPIARQLEKERREEQEIERVERQRELSSDEDKVIRTTLRIPQNLWDKAKHAAIRERTSLQDLMEKALREYLRKVGQQ